MKRIVHAIAAFSAAALICGCSQTSPSASTSASEKPTKVVLYTHDSFDLPKELISDFEKETGYTVETVSPGDAGTVVNQLILSKDAPLADVVCGIDTSFAGRALSSDILDEYRSTAAKTDPKLDADESGRLTPIDRGDVCVNADLDWFAQHPELPIPETLDDLARDEYKGKLVVENPASSSPGLIFLANTVATYGEDWPSYWEKLKKNEVKVATGWTEAYNTDFSRAGGDRPLVVSYSSSPAFELKKGSTTESHTKALLGTCFQQVEYAGVIKGAKNVDGAGKFIDFLLSEKVQTAIPDSMYVYPVVEGVKLPETWATVAKVPTDSKSLPVDKFDAKTWIAKWSELVLG